MTADEIIAKVKEQIDILFDSEEGRSALEDFAVFIETNLEE